MKRNTLGKELKKGGQLKEFLSTLFEESEGYIELRTINNDDVRQFFYHTKQIDRLVSHLFNDDLFKNTNIYFGVCPRAKKRGKEESVKTVNCLWADLDCKDEEERQKTLEKLKSFKLPPSIIVNSGHGYHPYWLLSEPYLIATDQDKLKIKRCIKGLSIALNGDRTFDLPRILRVPGTKNIKDPNNPLPVEILEFKPALRYKLTELEQFEVDVEDVRLTVDISPDEIPDRFWRILGEDSKLKATWEGGRKDLKDKTRSGFDMALANLLMPYGFSDSEIATILQVSPSGKEKEATKRYLALTIAKARQKWNERRPLGLEDILTTFKKWLELEETEYIEAILAIVVSNEIPGDPVWLFVIGPPGSSKTEILRSFKYLKKKVFITSKLTARSLISGKQTKDFDPSLLPKLDNKTLIIKDFTSILSMRSDEREIIFSDLRESFDGYLDKEFGNIGHKGYHLHFSVLAGVTPVLDKYSSIQQNLGDRFLKIRLKESDTDAKVKRAIDNENKQEQMREELAIAVKRFYSQNFNINEVKLPEKMKDELVNLANFVAMCRTTVSRDPYHKNIVTYLPEYEVATRIGIQLTKLGRSLAATRRRKEIGGEEFRILKRVGVDSIPKKVRVLLEVLNGQDRVTTSEIAERTGIEGETCRLALNDLAVLKLVDGEKIEGRGNPIAWKVTEKTQALLDKLYPLF